MLGCEVCGVLCLIREEEKCVLWCVVLCVVSWVLCDGINGWFCIIIRVC